MVTTAIVQDSPQWAGHPASVNGNQANPPRHAWESISQVTLGSVMLIHTHWLDPRHLTVYAVHFHFFICWSVLWY